MDNPDIGDRTGLWFLDMLVSLGLDSMDDAHFKRHQVDKVLKRFLNRDYEHNGKGGLFTVNNGRNMQTTEIWYQMNYHLLEFIKEGGL